jgi:hypothetical protein
MELLVEQIVRKELDKQLPVIIRSMVTSELERELVRERLERLAESVDMETHFRARDNTKDEEANNNNFDAAGQFSASNQGPPRFIIYYR